jgi:hypothetical protein
LAALSPADSVPAPAASPPSSAQHAIGHGPRTTTGERKDAGPSAATTAAAAAAAAIIGFGFGCAAYFFFFSARHAAGLWRMRLLLRCRLCGCRLRARVLVEAHLTPVRPRGWAGAREVARGGIHFSLQGRDSE